jgi:hypothetical protein
MLADAHAYVKPGSTRIVISLGFGVGSIEGDREKVCTEQVRIAAMMLLGSGKDAYGRDMRDKLMVRRLGPQITADTVAAEHAGHLLSELTSVKLQISELGRNRWISCELDATGGVTFQASKAAP